MKQLVELVIPAKSAVIVVDVQNDYCEPEGALGKVGLPTGAAMAMIPTLQAFLTSARAAGTPVIFIQTNHTPETDSAAWSWRNGGISSTVCRKNTWGSEFTGVAPLPDEPVVVKHRYSAFINTRLDSVLRTLKVENIIVLGVATNVCVESTSRHGFMLDYNTVLVPDCSAGYDQTAHDMTVRTHAQHFGRVATAQEIIDAWAATHSVAASV